MKTIFKLTSFMPGQARFALVIMSFLLMPAIPGIGQKPLMHWDFEHIEGRNYIEPSTFIADTIEGNFEQAGGVSGNGLRLDGFTTRVVRKNTGLDIPGNELTVEGWIALGEYPWNWCPVLTTSSTETNGYRLMVGPHGEASLQVAVDEQWISCTSAANLLPLRKWIHLTGVYAAGHYLKLYVNGEQAASLPINGTMSWAPGMDYVLGMVTEPGKPSDIIRPWGTVAAYYGLEGIIDEINVYDRSLTGEEIQNRYKAVTVSSPDIPVHRLPVVENPHRFGAYYTKLKYYPGWDTTWPVDNDPDIVVRFGESPVKLIFWRGLRYGPAWVSENEIWMADQSVETWNNGLEDTEGCFEHMQDRHCRFSHVRIIENSDARAVVHWRYAPVSSHDHTWHPDPKTGWEAWVDEYYYIYPDGSAIRKASWNDGTLGRNVQFQESLPLLQPGQKQNEILDDNYVNVADYDHHIRTVSSQLRKQPSDWPGNYTIQQFNFKAENKPFICFDPGNHMFVRWIKMGYNHFPVGQARCDGRWAVMSDRPEHIVSSPISDPVIHENGNRRYWNGLYGMNGMNMDELINLGRSWSYPAEMTIEGREFHSEGYDKSQRCYVVTNEGSKANKVTVTLKGSKDSPVINPAVVIKNWNAEKAEVLVNGKKSKDCRVGTNHELGGTDLVIFIFDHQISPVQITVMP